MESIPQLSAWEAKWLMAAVRPRTRLNNVFRCQRMEIRQERVSLLENNPTVLLSLVLFFIPPALPLFRLPPSIHPSLSLSSVCGSE